MKILIVGAGEIGSHLARMLSAAANDVTVIDGDIDRLNRLATTADVASVHGSPTSIKTLQEAGAADADLFIAVYPYVDQEVNLVSALLAKNLGASKVTARIHNEEFLSSENKLRFKEMGIELMFYPGKIAADEIVANLSHDTSAETMDFAHGKLVVTACRIEEDSPVLDMKISELTTLEDVDNSVFRIIAISRGEKTIIPHFDSKIQYHDLLYIISTREGGPMLSRYFGQTATQIRNVMVLGGSSTAAMIARKLPKMGIAVTIIEKDRERCMELSEQLDQDVRIVYGDGRNTDFLIDEGIKECDAFIALTESDDTNLLACVVAGKFGVDRTIAEVENMEYIHLAEEMGVDSIINKKLLTAGRIFKFTLSGKARTVKYMAGTNAEILEYTAEPLSRITRTALRDVGFPENAIIGGVIRGNDTFIAVGDTQLEGYDRVVVFALPEAVKEVDSFFR